MSDELVIAFLNWLTDGGKMRLAYKPQEGMADELWLGAKQVSRSDLARIVRRWPGGSDLNLEAAGTLVGLALDKVSTPSGSEWSLA